MKFNEEFASVHAYLCADGYVIRNIKPRKNRNIWRLNICDKDDVSKFKKEINFFHPVKRIKLSDALNSNEIWR